MGIHLHSCPCCRRILVDQQYGSFVDTFAAAMQALGIQVDYYADVRGASFDLDLYPLVALSLPDSSVGDSFVAEQWSNLGDWSSPTSVKRIVIGADWRGEGDYELAVSDTVNALGTGMSVLSDEGFSAAPVAGNSYTPEVHSLTAGVSEIATGSADEISGGTTLCKGANPDRLDGDGNPDPTSDVPFIQVKVTDGISYVMLGSPSVLSNSNTQFFQNLYEVS